LRLGGRGKRMITSYRSKRGLIIGHYSNAKGYLRRKKEVQRNLEEKKKGSIE